MMHKFDTQFYVGTLKAHPQGVDYRRVVLAPFAVQGDLPLG